ncbi:hypothetical protein HY633_03555 [Candidatus Uhrbacteria bacterium]|nr:hypothetical protein [Candidatus Uhrbacteria bacterium]
MSAATLTAEVAQEYLRDVEPMWRAFWFHLHLVAKNLEEFAAGLGGIDDATYQYHVSGQKNDLARWVHEVIGDSVLARHLAGAKSKDEAADIVAARLAELKALTKH